MRVVPWRDLVLTLAARGPVLHLHFARSLRSVRTLHSHLDVTVNLSFPQFGRREHPSLASPARFSASSHTAESSPVHGHHTFAAFRPLEAFLLRPLAPAVHGRTMHGRTMLRSPLEPVFARARARRAGEMVAGRDGVSGNWLPTGRSEQIVRRVVQERRRVEQRAPLAVVMPRSAAPAAAASVGDTAFLQSPRGLRVGATGMAQPPVPVDIERLTDQVVRQINHGIIAQRERMGRLS